MEFLVRNTSSDYHIVSMEKLALAHIMSALSAFSRNELLKERGLAMLIT